MRHFIMPISVQENYFLTPCMKITSERQWRSLVVHIVLLVSPGLQTTICLFCVHLSRTLCLRLRLDNMVEWTPVGWVVSSNVTVSQSTLSGLIDPPFLGLESKDLRRPWIYSFYPHFRFDTWTKSNFVEILVLIRVLDYCVSESKD